MVHFQKVIIEGGGEYWNCRTVFDLISVLDLKFWGQMTGWLNFYFGEGNGDSESGKAIYGKRKYSVEPPFGHIKSIMGFTGFQLRGKQKVTAEFKLVSIAHNLRKIWFHLKTNGKNLAEMCPTPGC